MGSWRDGRERGSEGARKEGKKGKKGKGGQQQGHARIPGNPCTTRVEPKIKGPGETGTKHVWGTKHATGLSSSRLWAPAAAHLERGGGVQPSHPKKSPPKKHTLARTVQPKYPRRSFKFPKKFTTNDWVARPGVTPLGPGRPPSTPKWRHLRDLI